MNSKDTSLNKSTEGVNFLGWVMVFFLAVKDLIGIAIIGFIGWLLFFVGWGFSVSPFIIWPLRIFIAVWGFALFMKPTLIASNINRFWHGRGGVLSWILGEKLINLLNNIKVVFCMPFILIFTLTIWLIMRILSPLQVLWMNTEKREISKELSRWFTNRNTGDGIYPFYELAYGNFFVGVFWFFRITNLFAYTKHVVVEDRELDLFTTDPEDFKDMNGRGQVVTHPHIVPIVLLNLILGATGFFWMAAHIWASVGTDYFLELDDVEDHNEEIRLCPYCAEEVKLNAIKCKHCGEWFKGAG